MRRFLIPLFVVALAACGGKSDIDGKLTVHTGLTTPSDGTVRVLLGDGSKFDQPVDAKGDVTFTDPSLSGLVDVTVVQSVGQSIEVQTVAGYGHPELWTVVQTTIDDPNSQPTPLSGQVTGFDSSRAVYIEAVGDDAFGGTFASSNGSFSLTVDGSGPAALFAEQLDDSQRVLRVGLLPVTLDGTAKTSLSFAVDHPVNQSFSLGFSGLDAYDPQSVKNVQATLRYRFGDQTLFTTEASGPPPLSIPAIAATAPFDQVNVSVSSGLGNELDMPFGAVQFSQVVGTATSATVDLISPTGIISPKVTPQSSTPREIPASDLRLRWNADGRAQAVGAVVQSQNSTGFSMSWSVVAPSGVEGFDFFDLPKDASPIPRFTPGPLSVAIGAFYLNGLKDYSDLFAGKLADIQKAGEQINQVEGFITLK